MVSLRSIDQYVKPVDNNATRSSCGGCLTILVPVLLLFYAGFRAFLISSGKMLRESTSVRIFPSSFTGRELYLPELECIAASGCYYVPMQLGDGNPRCCHYLAEGEKMPEKHRRIYATPDPTETFTVAWVAPDTLGGGELNFGMSYKETSVVDTHTWSLAVVEPGGFSTPSSKKVHKGTSFWSLVETNKSDPWTYGAVKRNMLWTTTVVSEDTIDMNDNMCCGKTASTAGASCEAGDGGQSQSGGQSNANDGQADSGGNQNAGNPGNQNNGQSNAGNGGNQNNAPSNGGSQQNNGQNNGGNQNNNGQNNGGNQNNNGPNNGNGQQNNGQNNGNGQQNNGQNNGGGNQNNNQNNNGGRRRLSGVCELGGISDPDRLAGARLLPFPTYTAVDVQDMGPFGMMADLGGVKAILDTIGAGVAGLTLFVGAKVFGQSLSKSKTEVQDSNAVVPVPD